MKSISNTLIAAIFAVVLTGLVALLLKTPFFETKESQTSDQLMNLRHQLQHRSKVGVDPHLVLAAIDEKSLKLLGAWPFSRNVHGQFLGVMAAEKPKVIAWDIFFTEAHSNNDASSSPATENSAPSPSATAPPEATPPADATTAPPATPAPSSTTPAPSPASSPAPAPSGTTLSQDDQDLVDGAALNPNTITAADRNDDATIIEKDTPLAPTQTITHVAGDISKLLSSKGAELPFPALREKSYFGFVDQNAENGGGVRRAVALVVNINGHVLPSLDLQTLMRFWGVDPDKVLVYLGQEITVPKPDGSLLHIPIDEKGQMTINYRARAEEFPGMSYAHMGIGLADKANNTKSTDAENLPPLKDNIVVIGVTFTGTDAGPTPIDPVAPLVSTHLNAISNLLQGDFVKPLSIWIWLPLYSLLLFAVSNLMLRVGVIQMVPIALGTILAIAAVAFATLYFANLQAPLFMPEVGLLLLSILVPSKGFFGEEREKQRVKAVLKANLSEKVMTKMLEHPDNIKLGGVKQVITVMFCDIRGFTKYCDNRDSSEVMDVLNDYMEEMTQVVFKYDGTVDKYIGDCIMAFWNAPELQPDHAQRAVCCAMEMRYALANFKTKRAGKDIELFECGIGITSGEALVGMMGSSLKRNYTAMGSTVNLGARLEALTKRLNERILISQETLDLLTGDFPITDRGEATVPGFANPIHVYAVGAEQDISSALKVGRTVASQQEYTAEEVEKPIWEPAPLPKDADPNP